jgi:hypothetical protein
VYNYHDSRACGYKRSRILPRLDGIGNGMVLDMVSGVGFVELCHLYIELLCGSHFVVIKLNG